MRTGSQIAGGAPARSPSPVTVRSDGMDLAGLLFLPAERPRGALLVCHGAGSRKENHGVMGDQAVAAGLAALTFDLRGHGQSPGIMNPQGWHDAVAAGELLLRASGAPWLAARGASLGGCLLLQAAHARPRLFAALILLCPADGASLLRGLDRLEAGELRNDPYGAARFDAPALRPFLRRLDLVGLARGLPRVLLAHARDDDEVPFEHSERLAAVLASPTRFIALGEGGHHGPGRSPHVARATVEWAFEHGPALGGRRR